MWKWMLQHVTTLPVWYWKHARFFFGGPEHSCRFRSCEHDARTVAATRCTWQLGRCTSDRSGTCLRRGRSAISDGSFHKHEAHPALFHQIAKLWGSYHLGLCWCNFWVRKADQKNSNPAPTILITQIRGFAAVAARGPSGVVAGTASRLGDVSRPFLVSSAVPDHQLAKLAMNINRSVFLHQKHKCSQSRLKTLVQGQPLEGLWCKVPHMFVFVFELIYNVYNWI